MFEIFRMLYHFIKYSNLQSTQESTLNTLWQKIYLKTNIVKIFRQKPTSTQQIADTECCTENFKPAEVRALFEISFTKPSSVLCAGGLY